jgi:methionyl-tRNA synthetase
LNKPKLLFEKIEDEVINKQVQKLMDTKDQMEKGEVEVKAAKELISYDDFMKMDIRVGEILTAEPVPKSNKLLKFTVDTGIDQRTILSGVAKYFKPEEMIGKKVTVLVNLAPRKIMGIESQGMLLFAENGDGSLHLVTPADLAENGGGIS